MSELDEVRIVVIVHSNQLLVHDTQSFKQFLQKQPECFGVLYVKDFQIKSYIDQTLHIEVVGTKA